MIKKSIQGNGCVFVESPPHRRTIRFKKKFYQIALPRLFFAQGGPEFFRVFVGIDFPDPQSMETIKDRVGPKEFIEYLVSKDFAVWNFYNINPECGAVCLGNTKIPFSHDLLDYFWQLEFNRGLRPFMRPIFVKGRLLPIVNLRQWARLTKKDPDLQNKLDVENYIAGAKYRYRLKLWKYGWVKNGQTSIYIGRTPQSPRQKTRPFDALRILISCIVNLLIP